MVDRAVLALGKEKRLNPLKSFLEPGKSWIRIRDTRNDVLGDFFIKENPGGGGSMPGSPKLFDNVTVRKNFQTVPYYNQSILVKDGKAKVYIDLPDNLTDFAIRAIATDGKKRFGSAKSMVSIRLPLIIQSALPRFVRPGDTFKAGAIGRIVDGPEGGVITEIEIEGLKKLKSTSQEFDLIKNQAKQIYFPLEVTKEASLNPNIDHQITIRMAMKRLSDQATDAFEVQLPVKLDRDWEYFEQFKILQEGETIALLSPMSAVRPGTLSSETTVSNRSEILKLLSGITYLNNYIHGCSEQRVSRISAQLHFQSVLNQIGQTATNTILQENLNETLKYLEQTQKPSGLYSFWPGSKGYVSLTAFIVEFLYDLQQADYSFNNHLLSKSVSALKESLRSDYEELNQGNIFGDRTSALAALAHIGQFDQQYAFELAARAKIDSLDNEARILYSLINNTDKTTPILKDLEQDLWNSLNFKLK